MVVVPVEAPMGDVIGYVASILMAVVAVMIFSLDLFTVGKDLTLLKRNLNLITAQEYKQRQSMGKEKSLNRGFGRMAKR